MGCDVRKLMANRALIQVHDKHSASAYRCKRFMLCAIRALGQGGFLTPVECRVVSEEPPQSLPESKLNLPHILRFRLTSEFLKG
jgi:hypothetical protein